MKRMNELDRCEKGDRNGREVYISVFEPVRRAYDTVRTVDVRNARRLQCVILHYYISVDYQCNSRLIVPSVAFS